jgi:hypothetical protein
MIPVSSSSRRRWLSVLGVIPPSRSIRSVNLTLGALTGYQLLHVTPSGAPITELPLALISTAVVPLLFALHITSVSALVRAPRTPLPATAPPAPAAV